MSYLIPTEFDVLVIGGGHAGIEAALAATRSAMADIPFACNVLSEVNSLTETSRSCTQGKERIGSACFSGQEICCATHCFILCIVMPVLLLDVE